MCGGEVCQAEYLLWCGCRGERGGKVGEYLLGVCGWWVGEETCVCVREVGGGGKVALTWCGWGGERVPGKPEDCPDRFDTLGRKQLVWKL